MAELPKVKYSGKIREVKNRQAWQGGSVRR